MASLLRINDQLSLEVHSDGIRLINSKGSIDSFLAKKPTSSIEKRFLPVLPILLEMGIAQREENGFFIANADIDALYGNSLEDRENPIGDQLASLLPPKSPYTLDIENTAYLASPQLEYQIRFHHGTKEVYPTRNGRFLKRGSLYYLLPSNIFELCEAIEQFNALPINERTPEANYLYFSKIKLQSHEDVSLSETMRQERILVPQQVGLNFEMDNENRLYVFPVIDGISNEALKEQFQAFDSAQDIYHFQLSDGGRVRLLVSPEIKDAMNHMRQHLTGIQGEQKDRVLLKPQEVFGEVCPPETIKSDLEDFGPRVIGIGPYVYQPVPKLKQTNRPKILGDWDGASIPDIEPVLEVVTGDGEIVDIPLQNGERVDELRQQVQAALLENKPSIEIALDSGQCFKLDRRPKFRASGV